MYPNPQDALPLPPGPGLERYRRHAEDLVAACRSGHAGAVDAWASGWIETLLASSGADPASARDARGRAARVAEFARRTLQSDAAPADRCRLADAQHVIARAHGFLSWPELTAHLESLTRAASPVSLFEAAADAIVTGDLAALQRLLRERPDLVHARSTREHRATLLHYVSANGVEGYRQRSPKNAAAIARLLLDSGADVDPEAEVYGGGCTPLGLVATSTPPRLAGVQREVIDVLLDHGARMDHPGLAGNRSALVRGCLMNGCPEAAEYLARRGAPLDVPGAAGLGDLDAITRFVGGDGAVAPDVTPELLDEGVALASGYGHAPVVQYLLDHGVAVDRELHLHGDGHTALHVAAFHGHAEVVTLLLARGADVHSRDKSWGTPPLSWAVTGWQRPSHAGDDRYYAVVALLVRAGADVPARLLESEAVRADPRMRSALSGTG